MAAYCPNPRAHQDYIPLCRICGEEGHEDKDCPKNSLNLAKGKGKQISDEGPSSSANLVEVVVTDAFRLETPKKKIKHVTFTKDRPMVNVITRS